MWFPTGQSFKVVFAPATDSDPPASPYWSKDNLAGINDVSAQTGTEWISGPAPTFVGTTQFTLAGDQTLLFTAGRRIKTTNTGGTVYSTIMNSAFGVLTTVNVINDGAGILDSGLSAVFYGLFDPANPSISSVEVNRKGAAVASSGTGTTNIWGSSGDYIHITGTNTIWNFSTAPYAGAMRDIVFDGVLPINSSAAITTVNITTAPNDTASIRAETVSTTVLMNYKRNGLPFISPQSSNTVYAGPSSGTTTAFPTFRQLVGIEAGTTLLSSKAGASSATLSFNNADFDWTAYDQYRFDFVNILPSNNGALWEARISIDGTNFIATTTYVYAYTGETSAPAASATGGTGQSNMILNPAVGNSVPGGGLEGYGILSKPSNSISFKKLYGQTVSFDGTDYRVHNFLGSHNATTSALLGIQFFFSAGNINSGTVYAYGIRKT